jgi:2,3-dihydroxy-p-cumate/2,3-dihydroxybenzoate 3,4-dioxygenase
MIDLLDIRYVRLGTRDLAGAARFAAEILGLEPVRGTSHACAFRSDRRDHTLVYFDGAPDDHTVGFEVRSRESLDIAAAMLTENGVSLWHGTGAECDERGLERFIAFADPTGNRIELVVAAGGRDDGSYRPARDAGITGFSHVGLRTTDARRDEAFWCRVLGARVSDRIGDAALLRIDPVHHKVALFPSLHAGIQHINHQVASFDDVMRSWYFLRGKGVRTVFGPGRHPTSGATFLYFEGPDGMIFEYSSGVRTIAPDEEATYQPRQLPHCNASYCMWGSVPELAEFESAGF